MLARARAPRTCTTHAHAVPARRASARRARGAHRARSEARDALGGWRHLTCRSLTCFWLGENVLGGLLCTLRAALGGLVLGGMLATHPCGVRHAPALYSSSPLKTGGRSPLATG